MLYRLVALRTRSIYISNGHVGIDYYEARYAGDSHSCHELLAALTVKHVLRPFGRILLEFPVPCLEIFVTRDGYAHDAVVTLIVIGNLLHIRYLRAAGSAPCGPHVDIGQFASTGFCEDRSGAIGSDEHRVAGYHVAVFRAALYLVDPLFEHLALMG